MFERQIGLQSDPSADPNVEPHTSYEFSPILHRFLWRTVSKPMWEYTSDLELLKGYLAALKGVYCVACNSNAGGLFTNFLQPMKHSRTAGSSIVTSMQIASFWRRTLRKLNRAKKVFLSTLSSQACL